MRLGEITKSVPHAKGLILLACALYSVFFGLSYMTDPLALAPQLDARENLTLAEQLDQGSLPPEPAYRAMLYPRILSLMHPAGARPTLALLFGLCCHLINGWLVYRISRLIWDNPWAWTVSCALYLMNPASLFYSVQVLDITFSTTLFLAALLFGLSSRDRKSKALLCGLFLGLSTLARPHFLPVAIMAPLILSFWPRSSLRVSALAWVPIVLLLLLQGLDNYRTSGDFRVLPWQGSYNLYAANRAGANGLYYKQTLDMSGREENGNPARAESVALYAKAFPGEDQPYEISNMNSYWKSQFLGRLTSDPVEVCLLWMKKGYAVMNSYEQYNNLTFSYQKQRLPLLAVNLLNWGLLLVLGVGGLYLLSRGHQEKAIVVTLLILFYTASLIIYYASARFRLPLVPLMALLGGGTLAHASSMVRHPLANKVPLVLMALSGILAFSSFADIRNKDTYIQDRLLLANAHADLGHDAEAALSARSILADFPNRSEALRIYALSYFNMHLLGQDPNIEFGNWKAQQQLVTQQPPSDPVQDVVLGIYFFKWGKLTEAKALWESIASLEVAGSNLAKGCLRITGLMDTAGSELSPLEQALETNIFKTGRTQARP